MLYNSLLFFEIEGGGVRDENEKKLGTIKAPLSLDIAWIISLEVVPDKLEKIFVIIWLIEFYLIFILLMNFTKITLK